MDNLNNHALAPWCARIAGLRSRGRLDEAVDACNRLTAQHGEHAPVLAELAHALRSQGKLEEARVVATRATELDPKHVSGWFNLGAARVGLGEIESGIEAYERALALHTGRADVWANLGIALGIAGRLEDEIAAYRRALAIHPQSAAVWSNLGNAERLVGRIEQAIESCRRAVTLDPEMPAAWGNLSSALREANRLHAAVEAAERATRLSPNLAETWSILGTALSDAGNGPAAAHAHERALSLAPRNPELEYNLAVALSYDGKPAAAIPHYRAVIRALPGHADAHWNLALALLATGQLQEGWSEYEWRWRRTKADRPRYMARRWDGSVTSDQRVLLWGEQGIGDQILYSSMLADLRTSGVRVLLEVDERLAGLYSRSFPHFEVVARGDRVAGRTYDAQSPLGSLGRWLRPTFDAFPRRSTFLAADTARATTYRARLSERGNKRLAIGISWISRNAELGRFKSIRLDDWEPLLCMPGLRFVDLQYGDTDSQRRHVENCHGVRIEHLPDLDLYNDLEGVAALVCACDLVVTVSNVTAHLAGALGQPVYLIAPRARGRMWYWFHQRSDSPWYPSMRIFEQREGEAWRSVLERVAAAIATSGPTSGPAAADRA